jgi:uncharacterized protein (DUF427 family)
MSIHTYPADRKTEALSLDWIKGRVVVFAGGRVLADTERAAAVRSQGVEAAWLVPVADLQTRWLKKNERTSELETQRTYYDLVVNGERIARIGWRCEGVNVSPDVKDYMALEPSLVNRVAVLPTELRVQSDDERVFG